MTISIRTILNSSNDKRGNIYTLINRRLQSTARGLGYWAARDYAKGELPGLPLPPK